MNKLIVALALSISLTCFAATDFSVMLKAAENGDSTARVIVANSYLTGEYRNGAKVETNINKAYAWASMANYQGNPYAQKLLNRIIPRLPDRSAADNFTGELFLKYGAVENSYVKQ